MAGATRLASAAQLITAAEVANPAPRLVSPQPILHRDAGFPTGVAMRFHFGLAAVLVAAWSPHVFAADGGFSDTSVGFRYGTDFSEPGVVDAHGSSADIARRIVNLTHVDGSAHGGNLLIVDGLGFASKRNAQLGGQPANWRRPSLLRSDYLSYSCLGGGHSSWCAPDNSFKPTPLRGAAQVLGRTEHHRGRG